MSGIIYYILDTETNGIDTSMHEICEVSVIRASDKVQINRTVKVDRPELSNLDALKITGKTIDDLKTGVSKIQTINDINGFFESDNLSPKNRCVVGHNVSFDRRFLHFLWEKFNKKFPCDLWMDTMAMMRAYNKKNLIKQSVKLENSLNIMKIASKDKMHTAKGDARNTFYLWEKLIKEVNYLEFIKRIPHLEESGGNFEDIY